MGNKRLEIDRSKVAMLAREGVSDANIARAIGVSIVTLKARLKDDELLSHEHSKARSESALVAHGNRASLEADSRRVGSTPVNLGKAERAAIKKQPEYAIRHFIRNNPGANAVDIRRSLGLSEDSIAMCLARLSIDKGVIRAKRRDEDEVLAGFYYVPMDQRRPCLAA